ncbi:hypothetical protein EV368DRAFT_16973, partial [Lentinula lateritia]
ETEWEVYARLLLPRKRGYPLWSPKPHQGLPEEYRRVGVRVGDVGILNELGGFDYLFNACLPADHPVNIGRVPPDFRHLQGVDVSGTTELAQNCRAGSHVANPELHISRDSKEFRMSSRPVLIFCSHVCRGVSKEVGAGLSFTSSATKGSLLILPEGASQIDHQEYTKFYRFAAECARSWYTYVNGPLARGAHNGSLYLVTGCDKARAWGVASFVDAHPGSVSLDFVPEKPDNERGPPEYSFSKCNSASSSSDADNIFQNQTGCVFLRGFKIAVKIPPFMTSSNVAAKVTYIGQLSPDNLLPQSR